MCHSAVTDSTGRHWHAFFVRILIQDRMPFPPVSNWEAVPSFACSASLSFLYSCFFLLRCIDFCVFNHSRHISLLIRFSWNEEGRKHFGKFEVQQVFCIISLTLDIVDCLCGLGLFVSSFFKNKPVRLFLTAQSSDSQIIFPQAGPDCISCPHFSIKRK